MYRVELKVTNAWTSQSCFPLFLMYRVELKATFIHLLIASPSPLFLMYRVELKANLIKFDDPNISRS